MERDVILEEFVEFRLYPDLEKYAESCKGKRETTFSTESFLSTLRTIILSHLQPELSRYIWHEGLFDLRCNSQGGPQPYLFGRVSLGDGLEDEWFVTHLLLKISKTIPGLVASVVDADGDFMLIEAAEHLPDWLEPETSENRTFIFDGEIQIVPITDVPRPTLQSALEFIRHNSAKTKASDVIQQTIKNRLQGYTLERTIQETHKCRVVLPRKLAQLLTAYSQSITSITSCLSSAAPKDVTRASLLKSTCPRGSGLDLVPIQVTFTRLQFAQLLCAKMYAPSGYPMPLESSPDFLGYSLGIKLAIGAELAILKHDKVAIWTEAILGIDTNTDFIYKGACKAFWNVNFTPLAQILQAVADSPIATYNGPDDDMNWLDVEEGPILNDLADKMSGIQLAEQDADQIMQKMMEEEENPLLSDRLLEFMKATSGLDGIYYDPEIHSHPDESQSDDGEEGISDSGLEEDDKFVEREILEAVMNDPDLLMKILERGEDLGIDCQDLLDKMQHVDRDTLSRKSERPQKGLADIDSIKLAEARQRSRSLSTDKEFIKKVHQEDSTEEEVDAYFSEAKPPKTTLEQTAQSISDPESEQDVDLEEYMQQMDSELSGKAIGRENSHSANDFKKSIQADKSPSHALVLGLNHK